jgi:hypothetical protein
MLCVYLNWGKHLREFPAQTLAHGFTATPLFAHNFGL